MKLTIDFETRSGSDLAGAGPWKYAHNHTTEVMCLAIKEDDRAPYIWVPDWVLKHINASGHTVLTHKGPLINNTQLLNLVHRAEIIEAHNAGFERAIWAGVMHRKYGFADIPLEKFDCSAARAAAMALPRSLEKLGNVLGLSEKKDKKGHALMLKMCKPRKPRKKEMERVLTSGEVMEIDDITFFHPESSCYFSFWHEKPEDFLKLFAYCMQDVETEYQVSKHLKPLSRKEKRVWRLDQRINQTGIYIDTPNVNNIIKTLKKHEADLLAEVAHITDAAVTSPRQVGKAKTWLARKGVHTDNLQKNTVVGLLKKTLPEDVKKFLKIRQALAKSSVAKFQSMVNRTDTDQRAKDLFLYCAAATGRWGGRSIQPQNMIRDSLEGANLESAYKMFQTQDPNWVTMIEGDPFTMASRCIRGAICAAPGKTLLCADYSAIEARGNAWQAGEESVLTAFQKGVDLYKTAAASTFNVAYDQVTKEQRQLGKVQILALGYQGGIGAFAAMAKAYNIDLETLPDLILPHATQDELSSPYGAEKLANIFIKKNPDTMSLEAAMACDIMKQKWRKANPKITASWRGLNSAAFEAVQNPGKIFSFRRIKFFVGKDRMGNGYLLCRLPSGRDLFYFSPKIKKIKNDFSENGSWSLTCRTADSVTKQWIRRPLYGGLLCENITQALCRDLLAEAMLRLDLHGYKIVLHVHDEIVAEVPSGAEDLNLFISIMEETPIWAEGMPIKAEGWTGKRYKK